jgi:hypothetical protein
MSKKSNQVFLFPPSKENSRRFSRKYNHPNYGKNQT